MQLTWNFRKRFVKKVCHPIRRPFTFLLGLLGLFCLLHLFLHKTNFFGHISSSNSLSLQRKNESTCSCTEEKENFKDLRGIKFYSEGDISKAYANQHVGFPGMEHVDCPMALSTLVPKNMYNKNVYRTQIPEILNDAQNCSYFVNKYGFNRYPKPSTEEESFPIAFSILFHTDIDQVLFLLRAIYYPHNAYCLSMDLKSPTTFLYATRAVARCLPNVFVSSKLEDVNAGISRLMADINCFRDLIKHSVKWRYIINSPGQQFPLKTNLEMVQILKLFEGTNDIKGTTGKELDPRRHQYVHKRIFNPITGLEELKITDELHFLPPFGTQAVQTSPYGSFSRPFVQFVLTSKLAKDLLEWCKDIFSPAERYWGMLNYNRIEPAPGGYLGEPDENPWITSFTDWEGSKNAKCRSEYVRNVCIFSPADLPFLAVVPHFFANKFRITLRPAALHCLDQRIFNKTISRTSIDTAIYRSILKNRLKPRNDI